MNRSMARRLSFPAIVLCLALLIPALIAAQDAPPSIPHTLEGREACLACHETGALGATQIPENHAGRTNETCTVCHQPGPPDQAAQATETPAPEPTATTAPETTQPQTSPTAASPLSVPHTLEGRANCLECHALSEGQPAEATGPPVIPHTLVGREHCLACHEQGVGGATQIPANHAGRGNETCQGCHQPGEAAAASTATPVQEPIPTPIAYPQAEAGVNTCVDCHRTLGGDHADITSQWQVSIHAERAVSCADCHGGDPAATDVNESMSPQAGYIGVPAKAEIPALCASCHANVSLMRPYDLPTDQFAKYRESIHGIRLAEGDTNVTTCFDCHGGHQILKANNPASTVYPSNVPLLCAGCHADKDLMAPYGIPTNQFDLYQQSVHGHALLDNQDFRAPNCATCHGTHGAAPPGFQEVANVCGSCHTATQDHYLKSPHVAVESGPKCVTCHGRYDVSKPSEALYLSTEPRHCGSCHAPDTEGGRMAQSLYDAIAGAAEAYQTAEAEVEIARGVGMLVTAQESVLREANTDLITARAAQHALDLATVQEKTDAAVAAASQAQADAEAAVAESIFRRQAMIIAVAAIVLTIVALLLLKRELDRRLEAEQ